MRKLLFCLMLLLVSPLAAESHAPYKVGFVNVPTILKNSPQVTAIEEALKAEYEERNNALVERRDGLKKLEEELQGSAGLSFEERSALERKVLTERRRIKQTSDELEEDITFKKTDEMNRLRIQIAETIAAIAKEQGIDLVFETAVVYTSDRADISEQVLERLKKAFEEGKGKAATK